MIDWRPEFPDEPRLLAEVLVDGCEVGRVSAGANNNGRTRSKDGRDGTGRYPWFASVGRLWQQGHADTLADAQRAAVEAARGMYRAALAACDDESNTPR